MRYRSLDAPEQEVQQPLPSREEPARAGTCLDCAGAIAAARLRAIPTAIRCTGCQRLYESQAL
jgi:RNA polymerase-binding transcription factor DksA